MCFIDLGYKNREGHLNCFWPKSPNGLLVQSDNKCNLSWTLICKKLQFLRTLWREEKSTKHILIVFLTEIILHPFMEPLTDKEIIFDSPKEAI